MSGICHDGKSLAFCALRDGNSAESFARSIALCFRAPRKPGAYFAVPPSNACVRPKDGFKGGAQPAARKTNTIHASTPIDLRPYSPYSMLSQ
jgi:hypothetical protein